MIQIRKAAERGHFDHGWLDTYHTFSFGDYHDPAHMSFRSLRVMNEDRVAPGQGFGMHSHRDMEIVTYVLSGALEHRDSMGNGEILRPGEFQRMSAGTGIMHSEFNPADSEPVHLYQIWLLPERKSMTPSYEQKVFPASGREGRWQWVASRNGRDGSLTLHQDAGILLTTLGTGEQTRYPLAPGRRAWLQVLRGSAEVNGQALEVSDGAALSDETEIVVKSTADSEFMLFDLA
ncbi:MAG: pirin family protein [Planctomycetes bacterium]|nr:pirin family protein [Planctomycetota bacterium]